MTRTDDTPIPDYQGLLRLDGRRFVVIGAGQGIGRQASHALASAGLRVLAVARARFVADRHPTHPHAFDLVPLGLIVSELVTNAFKYAYPTGGAGEIRVHVSRPDHETVELLVEDDGVGHDPLQPAKGTGLGTRILNAMATTMGGTLAYEKVPVGTRARMTFPTQ